MREKYCIRDCKGLKPLAREPQTQKEFYCEECALEFGVIPGVCVCARARVRALMRLCVYVCVSVRACVFGVFARNNVFTGSHIMRPAQSELTDSRFSQYGMGTKQ
jgi:hypothetical protein